MDIKLAITGARIIAPGGDPIPSGIALVGTDGRIAAVARTGEIAVPDGVPTIDASGKTLLPGLIDGHVHLTWDKALYDAHAVSERVSALHDRERQLVRAGHYAQMALAAGVTTLRDCGADDLSVLALRDMIAAGQFAGPRILAAGRLITTTAGHGYAGWGVDTADDMLRAVRTLASQGVDFIKIIVSGGTTTPGTNITRAQYGLDEIRVGLQDAHRLGLQVAAHAISTDAIRLAAEAGVDTIEHCSWISSDARTAETDEEAVDLMVRNGVRVDHAIIPRPYLFPDESAGALSPENAWWLGLLKVRWPFLRYMREQGVTVFLGTDAAFGVWPGTNLWPGFQDMARALEIMVRWGGFSPLEGIEMATAEAAKALRLDGEIGAIAEGRRADLILLAGDPLADIRALRQVDMVFRDGVLAARHGQIVLAGATAAGAGPRGWELPVR